MQKMRGVKAFVLADGLYASAIFRMTIRAKMFIYLSLAYDLTVATSETYTSYITGGDWKRTALDEYGGILFGMFFGAVGFSLGAAIGSIATPVGTFVGAAGGSITGAVFGGKFWKMIIKYAYEDAFNKTGLVQ